MWASSPTTRRFEVRRVRTLTVMACILNGLTDNDVLVHLRGGDLRIVYDEKSNHVFMTGPATEVFEGEIQL